MNGAGTPLRHDLEYLRRIVAEAVRLHQSRSIEDRVMLTDLRDYLTRLCIDAMEDEALARRLAPSLVQLWEELMVDAEDRRARYLDASAPAFYGAFLFNLMMARELEVGPENLLCRPISRTEFLESWEWTRSILGI